MNGVLIVDKPIGKTSFDIIRDVRKKYNIKKVGHIGTLDPMASGVLPVLIGNATKLSDYLMHHDKEYIATLHLGQSTDTGDSEGSIIDEVSVSPNIFSLDNNNNYNIIQDVLNSFFGESDQIPPMYSALKVNGKKLYELARQGQIVDRKSRKINIYNINLLSVDKEKNEFTFSVTCSKGTYIRVLCEDIAKKLGTLGFMSSLKRTRVGNFKIEDSGKFIDLKDIFPDIPNIKVSNLDKLVNGISLKDSSLINYSGLCNLFYNNNFIGIGEANNGTYKRKILTLEN